METEQILKSLLEVKQLQHSYFLISKVILVQTKKLGSFTRRKQSVILHEMLDLLQKRSKRREASASDDEILKKSSLLKALRISAKIETKFLCPFLCAYTFHFAYSAKPNFAFLYKQNFFFDLGLTSLVCFRLVVSTATCSSAFTRHSSRLT